MHAFPATQPAPLDQAHGLRRMFAATRQHAVPLVHNPHVVFAGVAMERLSAAFGAARKHALVVDAAETASAPHELARVDLAACIESLAPKVSYLAARGLPMRYLDARGTTGGFITALLQAAPKAEVLLLHAGASDLCRMFARKAPRPVLLASDEPISVTHAYAAMKVIAHRLGVLAFDLLIVGNADGPRCERIAERLSSCADTFLGAAIAQWAIVDPTNTDPDALPVALRRLASSQLSSGDEPQDLPSPTPTRRWAQG
ncbi:MAG: flagellar biosynthesis protein [Burkholderiales bacterium]|nr:flagellar biosynthesis protein [Burkholderiales bacterium]